MLKKIAKDLSNFFARNFHLYASKWFDRVSDWPAPAKILNAQEPRYTPPKKADAWFPLYGAVATKYSPLPTVGDFLKVYSDGSPKRQSGF